MKKKYILIILFLILLVVVIIIIDNKKNNIIYTNDVIVVDQNNITTNNIVNNIKYVEIKLEDKQKSEELTYTKSVRINDSKIIENLKKVINSGTEQVKENTEWSDISPFITLFAENGEEYEISTYDTDNDNEILISKYTNSDSENFDWKKIYSVKEPLGEYITKLYNEYKDTSLIEDAKENFQIKLEKYLHLYALREAGYPLLYCKDDTETYGLQLYDSYEEMEKDIIESNENIEIDNQKELLYKTSIPFSEYQKEMLKYVSNALFEDQFTTYQKDINGMLYVVNNAGESDTYEIKTFNQIGRNQYEATYSYYKGEAKPINGQLVVSFERNNSGDYVVSKCEF